MYMPPEMYKSYLEQLKQNLEKAKISHPLTVSFWEKRIKDFKAVQKKAESDVYNSVIQSQLKLELKLRTRKRLLQDKVPIQAQTLLSDFIKGGCKNVNKTQ